MPVQVKYTVMKRMAAWIGRAIPIQCFRERQIFSSSSPPSLSELESGLGEVSEVGVSAGFGLGRARAWEEVSRVSSSRMFKIRRGSYRKRIRNGIPRLRLPLSLIDGIYSGRDGSLGLVDSTS